MPRPTPKLCILLYFLVISQYCLHDVECNLLPGDPNHHHDHDHHHHHPDHHEHNPEHHHEGHDHDSGGQHEHGHDEMPHSHEHQVDNNDNTNRSAQQQQQQHQHHQDHETHSNVGLQQHHGSSNNHNHDNSNVVGTDHHHQMKIKPLNNNNNNSQESRRPKNFQLNIPRTTFSCRDRAPGYYADMEADCQVYHMCQGRGGGRPFLCPEGTRFNQRTFVCDHAAHVKCAEAANFFHRNLVINEAGQRKEPKPSLRQQQSKGRNSDHVSPLKDSPIFTIQVPNTIQARSNGRMAFAPLFEQERQKNVENFFKMVKPMANKNGDNNNIVKITVDQTPNTGNSNSAVKAELNTILGLPELPPEPEPNAEMLNDIFDDVEYSDDGKLQLLPTKQASKSVARFHKDREQPDLRLLLPPPPPPPPPPPKPMQLVGHILDKEDIKFVPNSPIFNISHTSGAQLRTHPIKQDFSSSSSRFDIGRHAKSGDPSLGIPLRLVPPDPVQPNPWVWISPASLARSPMVMLHRMMITDDTNNDFRSRSSNLENSLTMKFPARNSRRFDPLCLACFPNGDNCPPACSLV